MNYKKIIAIKLIEKFNKTMNLNSVTKMVEIFKNYKNDIDVYDIVNDIVSEMANENLINVNKSKIKGSSEIVSLSIYDNVATNTLSKIAGLKLKTDFYIDLFEIFEEFKNKTNNERIYRFCVTQQDNIVNKKAVSMISFSQEKYSETLQNMKDILIGCEAILNLKEDILLRNFSENTYCDSKKFEKIYKNTLKIIDEDFECSEESCEDILKKWHILKNPNFIQIKGSCSIEFNDGYPFILNGFKTPLGLSKDYIDNIKVIKTKKITTIENLTTFNCYQPNDNELAIFTSGYAEELVIKLLKSASSNTDIVHFGDLDAHGFRIAHNIFERINKPIMLFKMDVVTLSDLYNSNNTKAINENNEILLKKMIDSEKYSNQEKEVFIFMLKNKCIAEQEAIKF